MSRHARWIAALLLVAALPAVSHAQLSSTNFKLDGTLEAGAAMTSANFAMQSQIPMPSGQRSTSASHDLFPNFIGIAFSPIMIEKYPTQSKRYEMYAFPLTRSDSTPTVVLNELGGYDVRNWRLGHWNPVTSAYQEPGGGLDKILGGQGYWLITDGAQSGAADAGVPPNEYLALGVNNEYTLGPSGAIGWNQMGNPYPFPIDINSIIVTDNSTFGGLITNPANAITSQLVKVWDPVSQTYRDTTTINGRQGFWVKKLTTLDVHMFFLRSASAIGSPSPAAALIPLRGGSATPPVRDWSVTLVAHQGERASERMVVGAANVASDGWNTLCDGEAPGPPGQELLSLGMDRDDWGPLSGRYTRVFSPVSGTMAWDFTLRGVEGPGEVRFDVTTDALPTGTRLWLLDRTSGVTREIAPGPITLAAYAGERPYRLEVVSGDGGPLVATATHPGFVRAYPNPSRDASGLAFSLRKSGEIAVDIYDLAGRRVRQLARAGESPGDHVLVWDGRDAGGLMTGPGVYLARWRADGLSGTTRLVRVD